MKFIKTITTLLFTFSLFTCIHPVSASEALDLTADPVTPSSEKQYYFDGFSYSGTYFIKDNSENFYKFISYASFPNSLKTSNPFDYVNSLTSEDLSNYTFAKLSGFSGSNPDTGQVYGSLQSDTVMVITSISISNPTPYRQSSDYVQYHVDISSDKNISNGKIILRWNYAPSCPSDYGLHSDNFCYPYAEKYQQDQQYCVEWIQNNDEYIIQGIWETYVPEQILVKVANHDLYCVADAQYELLDGATQSTVKIVTYPERVTSKNYSGEEVKCVDAYYYISSIGVFNSDYLANPHVYPIANTAPSSAYCDPNNVIDSENPDQEFLDNPKDKKCVDDFDCDGIKDNLDDDIDNDGITNDLDDDDDNDGIKDDDDAWPWDDDRDDDGFKDGDSRDTDNGTGTNNDIPNDGYVDIPDCDIETNPECQTDNPDGTKKCIGDLLDNDNDGVCADTDPDDNNAECTADSDGDGVCNNLDPDDNNAECTADADNDGVCNDTDVNDQDSTAYYDLDTEATKACLHIEYLETGENNQKFLECFFQNKIKLRFEEHNTYIENTGLLKTYTDNFNNNMKDGVTDNGDGSYTVDKTITSFSCPTLETTTFSVLGETIDITKYFNLCDDNFNLFYDIIYWMIVGGTLLYITLNIFRRQ